MNKKCFLFVLIFLFTLPNAYAEENGLISIKSKFSVTHTADRFIGVIKKKGLTLFKHVKHSESAKKVGLEMQPTELVIFGNPKLGSPLMKCAPTFAIDLPQKMLIWQDKNQQTWLTYNNPVYIADRHSLAADCRGNLHKIAGALAKFTKIAGDND